MTYFEVQKLALAQGMESSKRRMSKAYMINELLSTNSNVDKLDCEDKIAATHDYRQVKDEINEYLADHDLTGSSVLVISWSESVISDMAKNLKSSTEATPFWSSMTSMNRVTHKQLRDELTGFLCGGIDHVGNVLVVPEDAEDWLKLANRLRDLSYDSYLQSAVSDTSALAKFGLVKDKDYSSLPMLPMPSGWATVFDMTYHEVESLAKARGVQSKKRHMSKSYMIDAILSRGAANKEDALDCEGKIAATHDYSSVKTEIDEYLMECNMTSSSVLLVEWNESALRYVVQELQNMGSSVPDWCSVKSAERLTPKDLLADFMAYLCRGIEHVGCVLILPDSPHEWVLLGQRLRDFCYDPYMQDVARISEFFPLATFTLLCEGNYVQLSMLPMPTGYNSLFA
ncbi:hypothetical protein ACHHYP_08341 [Achlya hypogyna]|uniref:Uncharacterized protein n=1 Tax=Achlya hypogyna TaxID=1202772 RepID=A0A1V9ZKP8_ACHHY|nr:hypothetical protein ACHHYP_08341 [Achlya hypogyna]